MNRAACELGHAFAKQRLTMLPVRCERLSAASRAFEVPTARILQMTIMALTSPDETRGRATTRMAALNESCAQAMSRQLAGELDLAAQMYRAILQAEPQHAPANHCLGMLLVQSKQPSESLPHLIAALAADPQVADYWLGYLEALLLAGQTDEAKSTLALGRQHGLQGAAAENFAARLSAKLLPPPTPVSASSISLPPANPPSMTGEVVRAERRRASRGANKLETQVLAQVKERNFAAAHISAGTLTRRFPDRGLGWKVLGALLAADGRMDEALSAVQEAARLLPGDAEVFCNLGVMLSKLKRFEEAEASLQEAISINPKFDDSYLNLGFLYASMEKFPEAEAMFRRAVAESRPGDNVQNDMRHSSLLFLLSHNPAVPAAQLFAEHIAMGRWLEGPVGPGRPRHSNDPEPERPLKVGIVSGDLNSHAVANFIEPVLEDLQNRRGLELHAYYNNEVEDAVSQRLRTCFSQWHSVSSLTDPDLVKLIKANATDILIDLSGHTSFNRLRAFALKPAPIQVSWLGYPGTTGLRAMDYYLADKHFLPPGQFEGSFTEKIAYLPAAWTFSPYVDSPPVSRLPALDTGFVTFGSFNRLGKINPFTVRLWSRLLREAPSSIIVMAGIPLDERRQALTELFNAEGIVSQRIAFFPRSDMETYLALHNQVDLCLDTFPYTGGTTTNHALWMGVPTLTLAGQTPASRQGAANLSHVGLEGFTASDADDFVEKGRFWSTEIAALAEVRRGLRERWLGAPLRQSATIATGLEAALRHMWRRWCGHLPTQSFSITTSNQVIQ
jgi:predicted O-linked N-acetylglucosamine transferase (SPINDLY family)